MLSCFAAPAELEAYLRKQMAELRKLAATRGIRDVEVLSLAEEFGRVARRHELTAIADEFDAIIKPPSE